MTQIQNHRTFKIERNGGETLRITGEVISNMLTSEFKIITDFPEMGRVGYSNNFQATTKAIMDNFQNFGRVQVKTAYEDSAPFGLFINTKTFRFEV